ncbi:uncharacterized protein LOC117651180 [Thrips palmi]|uniref:Uncharacterized protein LOC117651180 n=1 Tax=Thrips palmi TaxID=161013 RepID=A0A6P9A0L1_THRPL|nr:uncharacterized protein LOC117651180 [Thrips palmi]
MALGLVALLNVCLLLLLSSGATSLRMLQVNIPAVVLRGEKASLMCDFDLGSDRLYSMTWYKDHDEIYRFVPRAANNPKHSYLVDGVHVDERSSDERTVVLRSVTLRSSGNYRCEVSAEAPSFQTVHGEGRLEVVALPQRGPEISRLDRAEYQMGDTLSVNCTSDRSFPPAKLRWYINDRQVDPTLEAQMSAHGLVRTHARLVVQVGPQHFQDGNMALRCVATIRPSEQPKEPAQAAPAQAAPERTNPTAASLPTKHSHHQPLPRIAMEIDNREARLLDIPFTLKAYTYSLQTKLLGASLVFGQVETDGD